MDTIIGLNVLIVTNYGMKVKMSWRTYDVEYYEKQISQLEVKIEEYRKEIEEIQSSCPHINRTCENIEWSYCGEHYVDRYECPDCKKNWAEQVETGGSRCRKCN